MIIIQDYSNYKQIMIIAGIPMIVVGLFLFIYGFISFGTQGFQLAGLNQAIAIIGFIIFGLGIALLRFAFIRPVSRYVATEMSPGIQISGQSIGQGLKQSGFGLNQQVKEVIKIKCPHCGYLESEDADFCSKCGKKI